MPAPYTPENTALSPLSFSVVTFNVRYANTHDGADSWNNRKSIFADVLRELDPDVIGTQEALVVQIDAIETALADHQRIGVGRIDGVEAGEWSAIFVRRSRFEVLDHGNFWFSETPDVPGTRAWDAPHHPRLCTWAHLADRRNANRNFLIYNSHWDNEGVIARDNAAALIAERLESRAAGVPAIVTGDFNCTPDSAPVRYLTGAGNLKHVLGDIPRSPQLHDSWGETHSADGAPSGTFHGFRGGVDGDRIDYILRTDEIHVQSCEIVRTNRNGQYPSDHFPVRALLQLP